MQLPSEYNVYLYAAKAVIKFSNVSIVKDDITVRTLKQEFVIANTVHRSLSSKGDIFIPW